MKKFLKSKIYNYRIHNKHRIQNKQQMWDEPLRIEKRGGMH